MFFLLHLIVIVSIEIFLIITFMKDASNDKKFVRRLVYKCF